jgi:hypothetical protein
VRGEPPQKKSPKRELDDVGRQMPRLVGVTTIQRTRLEWLWPFLVKAAAELPCLRSWIRQPSNLISCSHCSPRGGAERKVGAAGGR